MVSIQVDTNGKLYYASRLNYWSIKKVGKDELFVSYDMVCVTYKLDKYDKIVYSESRYIPYHQHGEVQIYRGANAAGAITVMGEELLATFIADLVDLYKFFYHDPNNSLTEQKSKQTQRDSNMLNQRASQVVKSNECPGCKSRNNEGDLYCSNCGKELAYGGESSSKWHLQCQKCRKELPTEYVDAQNTHCIYCGSKTIKFYH